MLKKAAMREYKSRIHEYLNPLVIIAYVMFVGTTFLSIIAYRGIPLSMGPILEATSYLLMALTSFGLGLLQKKGTAKYLWLFVGAVQLVRCILLVITAVI